MSKKQIEPTDAMVENVALGHKIMRTATRSILRAALNHPDAPGLFADEDALRAAREQGWDQATRWIDSYQGGPNGRTTSARSANPYRPAPALPTEDGAVIVPAEGHEFIEATICGETHYARAALRSWVGDWYAAWRAGERKCGLAASGDITPGTWRVADQ